MPDNPRYPKPAPSLRGFDPSAVKLEHIKKFVLVYGDDVPGIEMRLEVFREVLEDAVDMVAVFKTTEEAMPYIRTGNIFSDEVHIIIENVEDMIKTKKDSRVLMKAFFDAADSFSSKSHFVMGCPISVAGHPQFDALSHAVTERAGIVRRTNLPQETQLNIWLYNYGISNGFDFAPNVIEMILEAAQNDTQKATSAIDCLGEEVQVMDKVELIRWMNAKEYSEFSQIQQALIQRDIPRLFEIRSEYPQGPQGDRVFLNKLRYICLDLTCAVADGADNFNAYIDVKKRFVGNYYSSTGRI